MVNPDLREDGIPGLLLPPVDNPQFVDAGAGVDHTFLIEIEMCSLRRQNLDNEIRRPLGSLFREKAAARLRKEA